MNANEIRAGVLALEPWFHQIDLGQGILTKSRPAATEPTNHPAATWQIIKRFLPDDLSGRSVLDVGCNAGFYAIEAKRRNAGRVVGIDSKRHHICQARFVARVLGLDLEYQRMSVYQLSEDRIGKFDVTLALGLIYHCKHLVLALQKLFEVTSDLLILESEVLFPSPSFESYGPTLGIGRRLHALAYVENDPSLGEAVGNWFIPSADSLKALLADVGFVDIKVVSEANARAVIICRRPQLTPDSFNMPQSLAAELTLLEAPTRCRPDEKVKLRVMAKNTGQSVWLDPSHAPGGKGAVRLGAHLSDQWGQEIPHNYDSVSLPQRIGPGASQMFSLTLTAPTAPGKYQLELDLVSEFLIWFEDAGSTIPLVHVIDAG
jgi:tRNA (mo5U34)-methyltransferase